MSFYNFKESPYVVNFNYANKKMSYLSCILNDFFLKMKEKKTILYNKVNDSIFLFASEYYTLDQISTYVVKYFTSKTLGNYENECLFFQLKAMLYEEISFLCHSSRI